MLYFLIYQIQQHKRNRKSTFTKIYEDTLFGKEELGSVQGSVHPRKRQGEEDGKRCSGSAPPAGSARLLGV